MDYNSTSAAGQLAASDYRDQVEGRPLEEISIFADRLNKIRADLEEYLGRFNGPQPSPLVQAGASMPAPAPCYRSELQRLRRNVDELDNLATSISRLG